MNKGFHLDPGLLNYFRNLGKSYLSCRIDSGGAHISPEYSASKIGYIGLGADMDGNFGNNAASHHEYSWISHNDGIRSHPTNLIQIVAYGIQFVISGIDVAGDIHFFPTIMDKPNRHINFWKGHACKIS